MFYHYNQDPRYIAKQIIQQQISFYTSYTFIVTVLHILFKSPLDFSSVLSSYYFALPSQGSFWIPIGFVLTSPIISVFLLKIVKRSKRCLDYTITLYCIHLIIVFLYDKLKFPCILWILATILSIGICATLSEYLCMKQEMRAIPTGFAPISKNIEEIELPFLPKTQIPSSKEDNNNGITEPTQVHSTSVQEYINKTMGNTITNDIRTIKRSRCEDISVVDLNILAKRVIKPSEHNPSSSQLRLLPKLPTQPKLPIQSKLNISISKEPNVSGLQHATITNHVDLV